MLVIVSNRACSLTALQLFAMPAGARRLGGNRRGRKRRGRDVNKAKGSNMHFLIVRHIPHYACHAPNLMCISPVLNLISSHPICPVSHPPYI